MSIVTEGRYAGEHIISEASRTRSREQIIIAASQNLVAGAVLGQVLYGALSSAAAAVAGNTGAATITAAPAVAAGTPPGEYLLTAVSAGATAEWLLADADEVVRGNVTTGVAATIAGIGPFTITDAGTDPAIGDQMRIVVTAAAADEQGRYKLHNPDAVDGTQIPAALNFAPVVTGVGQTAKAVAHVRDCEVNQALLGWGAHSTPQKTAALAHLKTLGVIAR